MTDVKNKLDKLVAINKEIGFENAKSISIQTRWLIQQGHSKIKIDPYSLELAGIPRASSDSSAPDVRKLTG
jgi:hypothetical protein